MNDKNVARRIVVGYLNSVTRFEYVDRIAEITLVNTDDDVLLEHIKCMISVLNKAKKEIESEKKRERKSKSNK